MTDKKRECDIPHCSNVIAPGSRLETCAACRGSYSYWKRKRPAQILDRRRALHKYDERLEHFIGDKQ